VAQIHHPNVVGIYRIGTYQHRPYFVTELVRGNTLAELSKPVAPRVALDIAICVARGLAAAHRRNVVHCDLKPSNVMLDLEGVAKIIDFGLARFAAEGANAGHMPVGTPDYMAPEVWSGEATFIHGTYVVLVGTVNPHHQVTTYWFELGKTTSYGIRPELAIEHWLLNRREEADEAIPQLHPHTTYHFRLVAHNRRGTTYGKDKTFTTRGRNTD